MWFVDLARITVKAGDGGRGCAAFAQPPYTRFPYPDGGDGGDGGDVIARSDPNAVTLLDFHFRHEFHAGRGGHGGSNRKTGRRGAFLELRVPIGTLVRDEETGSVIGDLARAEETLLLAKGGRGGRGNVEAAQALPGGAGERRLLTLELKLIADVGLVGLPNAGKSSLLSRLSSAHPKIAPYPFTTRYPVLGVVDLGERGTFVACDIPGLIEGAHEGKGLGTQFLRHLERTRLLVHVVDLAGVDGHDPVEAFHQVNRELEAYSAALGERVRVVAANKMDLPEAAANLAAFNASVADARLQVCPISCATGQGLRELLDTVWMQLHTP